jgi:hypothetical protein
LPSRVAKVFFIGDNSNGEPNQYNKNQQENFYYFNGGFAVTYILNDNELPNDGRSERARKYWSNSSPKKRWQ